MNYIQKMRKYVGHEPILTAGSVLLIFNEKNEILMQLRTDCNLWGFIGGSMELGESFEETAKRELKEETNLDLDELVFLDVFSGKDSHIIYPNGDEVYDITAIYKVTKYHGMLKINDNESKKLEWFPIDNLPKNLSPYTEKCINKYIDILKKCVNKK